MSATRANRIADLFAPATVVLFAGCGGKCIGIEQAYTDAGYADRYVDAAVNHWTTAVGVHKLNHPMTEHRRADVWEVDPMSVVPGREIALLHASPDCTHFSKARGSKPKKKEIRGLAWVVVEWAAKRRPTVITLENVEEFRQWGPLADDGQPCPRRRGETFAEWKAELEAVGYVVDSRELKACDYGAPTTRKRLFVVARRDGRPIVWPAKTHGAPASAEVIAGKLKPFRTAAECIDWSISMLSIFATPAEAKAFGAQHGVGTPRRPLKQKTLDRIAGGLVKWVLKAKRPFIVQLAHGGGGTFGEGRWTSTDAPIGAVHAGGNNHAVVDATIVPFTAGVGGRAGQSPATSADAPMPTVTSKADRVLVAAHVTKFRGESLGTAADAPLDTITDGGATVRPAGAAHAMGVTAATLAPYSVPRYGERHGQSPRSASVDAPAPTIVGTGNQASLVAALLTKHYTGVVGHGVDQPLDTITATDHNAISVAYLSHQYTSNTCGGQGDPAYPHKTITSEGGHSAVVAATVAPFTVGAGGPAYAGKPKTLDAPFGTVMVDDRRAVVAAFLDTYYGNSKDGGSVAEPMPTVVSKDRISLVTVVIDEVTYVVTDIAMRMLTPRELLLAQGFPPDYRVDVTSDGTPVTKADQVKLIGNSVPPPFARALVAANVVDQGVLGARPTRRTVHA